MNVAVGLCRATPLKDILVNTVLPPDGLLLRESKKLSSEILLSLHFSSLKVNGLSFEDENVRMGDGAAGTLPVASNILISVFSSSIARMEENRFLFIVLKKSLSL